MSHNKYTLYVSNYGYKLQLQFIFMDQNTYWREKMAAYLHISIRNYKDLHKNSRLKYIILIKDGSIVDFKISDSLIHFH